jgi:hypothetical protein
MLLRTGLYLTLLWLVFLLPVALDPPSVAADQANASSSGTDSGPTLARAAAASPPSIPPLNPTGQWVLPLGKRTLLVLSISNSPRERQQVSGSFARPLHFQMNSSMQFSHIEGPPEVMPIVASEWKGRILSITVQNPTNSADRSTFLLEIKDAANAELQIQGVPLPPFKLLRATRAASVSTDWEANRTYSPDDDVASNPKMRQIFEEDQRVRQPGKKIDWAAANKTDAEHRQATLKLLNDGALHSGEDFNWAAFVFQHGSAPEDYLLAHTLAMIALEKGYGDALWISTATLDRYLQSIKQPQIYGTQYQTPTGAPTTQEPYNRTLISDAVRLLLGVPTQSAQEAQRKQYDAQRLAPVSNK